jgi:hypothetical protein
MTEPDEAYVEPELWQTMPPPDDETVEKLRHLLFGQHAAPIKD